MKLIKKFAEGLKIYFCTKCFHYVNIPKKWNVRCYYCGNTEIK